jgi:hypothetical protein
MVTTTYQYPHYLYALKHEDAVQNPNTGSWETGSDVWELWGICREETNGKGHTIATSGGETIVFTSLIQLPVGTPRINEGTEVAVTRSEVLPESLMSNDFVAQAKADGLVLAQGKCMKYDLGRLHCRLWI